MSEYRMSGIRHTAQEVRELRIGSGLSVDEAKDVLDGEALSREVAKADTVEDLKYVLQALIDKTHRSRD